MADKKLIDTLLTWIKGHADKQITVADVACKSGYTKWYLNRHFKKYTGRSIGVLIRDEKMKSAASELICTNERIADIAEKYHFESQQTFTRAFTRHYGISPARYRQAIPSIRDSKTTLTELL
ncbi:MULTISPECIES: helix-turn-helix domain-containing protein [Enterobacterales]|nr:MULTISPECIES: helix-turn-helix domain-containing protein [Enterobacterales]AVG79007.1 helix-turn-helix domain-containing protein [Pantoea ananatis]MCK6896084.1 helix-turn-helix domain-containing protein [Enterobacter bugandensis]MCK7411629.1 helix-turn-helix domain-containing protein [Enterobacter bugandensis]MCM7237508.1 helix-turn-helix domain-containing protein [Enterobacter bugandensis]MCM7317701.1 helix-turn-helix domain-containing protein [Enterobacter bugandensis]